MVGLTDYKESVGSVYCVPHEHLPLICLTFRWGNTDNLTEAVLSMEEATELYKQLGDTIELIQRRKKE